MQTLKLTIDLPDDNWSFIVIVAVYRSFLIGSFIRCKLLESASLANLVREEL